MGEDRSGASAFQAVVGVEDEEVVAVVDDQLVAVGLVVRQPAFAATLASSARNFAADARTPL